MNPSDKQSVRMGMHWLNRFASELGKDAAAEIDSLDAWEMTAPEIALSILDHAFPRTVTREAQFTIRCWPWERARILKAAAGSKVEDWIREALIEKAMRET
jgi:hypothetical protein